MNSYDQGRMDAWERIDALKRRLGLLGFFNEQKHKRYPKGHPKAGQFMDLPDEPVKTTRKSQKEGRVFNSKKPSPDLDADTISLQKSLTESFLQSTKGLKTARGADLDAVLEEYDALASRSKDEDKEIVSKWMSQTWTQRDLGRLAELRKELKGAPRFSYDEKTALLFREFSDLKKSLDVDRDFSLEARSPLIRKQLDLLSENILVRGSQLHDEAILRQASAVKISKEVSSHRASRDVRAYVKQAIALTGYKGDTGDLKIDSKSPRGSYDPFTKTINLGRIFDEKGVKNTLFHEFGHFIENSKDGVSDQSELFLFRRKTSSKPVLLKQVLAGGRGRDDEKALPDHFINPYVGKVYEGSRNTEVVSVGLEHFTDPLTLKRFIDKDRDHFLFTMKVMQ